MRNLGVLLILGGLSCLSQTQNTTKGACSPILSGTNNRFTFYCDGLTPAQGKELLEILNRIARDQLDARAVMKALDEIKALAAKTATTPETIAKGLQMYSEGKQLTAKEKVRSLYETLTRLLEGQRLQLDFQSGQQAATANSDFNPRILNHYYAQIAPQVRKLITALNAKGVPTADLAAANSQVSSMSDLRRLSDVLRKTADPDAQLVYKALAGLIDPRTESAERAAFSEKMALLSYKAGYVNSISKTLEQLRSEGLAVEKLEEMSKNVTSVSDIQRLAEAFKQLADSLPDSRKQ